MRFTSCFCTLVLQLIVLCFVLVLWIAVTQVPEQQKVSSVTLAVGQNSPDMGLVRTWELDPNFRLPTSFNFGCCCCCCWGFAVVCFLIIFKHTKWGMSWVETFTINGLRFALIWSSRLCGHYTSTTTTRYTSSLIPLWSVPISLCSTKLITRDVSMTRLCVVQGRHWRRDRETSGSNPHVSLPTPSQSQGGVSVSSHSNELTTEISHTRT